MREDSSKTPSSSRRGFRAHASAIVLVMLLGSLDTAARAELPLLRDNYYEISPFYQVGGGGFGDGGLKLTGVHIYERNGYFGKVAWMALTATLLALGATDRVHLGTEYGPGYRVDYYRMKSYEELASDERDRDAVMDATADNDYQTDLRLYIPTAGVSTATGFSFETYPLSWTFGSTSVDLGLAFAHLSMKCPSGLAGSGRCRTAAFSMPLRVTIELGQIAQLEAQLELNFLAFGGNTQRLKHPHNVRIGALLNATQRMFVRGSLAIPSFDFGDIGLQLEAGVRF